MYIDIAKGPGARLLMCLVLLSPTRNSLANDDLYYVSFSVFPIAKSNGCAFFRAHDPESEEVVKNFRPSTAFMKAACTHFNAVWQANLPSDSKEIEYRIAVWHRSSPDTPTFMPMVDM